jgi:DNA-binding transcriptional ArsR family regulator
MVAAMDAVFKALADASRRQLLDRLHAEAGCTLNALCQGLSMSRQAVTKHLVLLEAANLVVTVRRGREKLHYLNPAPIAEIADRWIRKYDQPRTEALAALKRGLEESSDA